MGNGNKRLLNWVGETKRKKESNIIPRFSVWELINWGTVYWDESKQERTGNGETEFCMGHVWDGFKISKWKCQVSS